MKTIQQKLADRIYELLPEKKELEFGCEWILNNDIWTYANGFSFIKNNKNSWSSILPEKEEIIGQPIRLADVLLAIQIYFLNNDELGAMLDVSDGELTLLAKNPVRPINSRKYNLSKDNLLDQSDEFCEFVYNLIK